ncbi:MAG: putative sulfate exporter family transporter [Methanomassiliicoccus sp.]|nr:putative sulfate exporter family transporter [Methanomassiliicoccus sp.]
MLCLPKCHPGYRLDDNLGDGISAYREELKGYYTLRLGHLPGLAVCAAIALFSYVFTRGTVFENGPRILPSSVFIDNPVFSLLFKIGPIVLALMIGIFITWKLLALGSSYAGKYLLRLAIVLMGARVTADVLSTASIAGIVIIVAVMAFTIWLSIYLGKRWLVEKDASALVGTGNAVCGVSACLSVAPAIRAKPHNLYAVIGVISLLGLVGVFIIPYVAIACGLTSAQAAVFVGGSLHEIGNVIPAADLYHNAFGGQDIAGLVLAYKMTRVAMLVAVSYFLARWFSRTESSHDEEEEPVKFQGFLIAFVFVAILASVLLYVDPSFGNDVKAALVNVSASTLTIAMAGVGLSMDLRETVKVGRLLLPFATLIWAIEIALLLVLTMAFV